ncbi:MAG TPA: thioredoxin [Syntrophomonadaceae bacterium]|nr:thioredoxin [Syntrophomonadaceae bacterium]
MSNVKTITAQNFRQEVLESDQPVLIDFWAPWCGPCKMMGPVIDNVARENEGKIVVGKVNVDENQSLAAEYGIRGIPTMAIFKAGQEVKRIVGAVPKTQLQNIIDAIVE